MVTKSRAILLKNAQHNSPCSSVTLLFRTFPKVEKLWTDNVIVTSREQRSLHSTQKLQAPFWSYWEPTPTAQFIPRDQPQLTYQLTRVFFWKQEREPEVASLLISLLTLVWRSMKFQTMPIWLLMTSYSVELEIEIDHFTVVDLAP